MTIEQRIVNFFALIWNWCLPLRGWLGRVYWARWKLWAAVAGGLAVLLVGLVVFAPRFAVSLDPAKIVAVPNGSATGLPVYAVLIEQQVSFPWEIRRDNPSRREVSDVVLTMNGIELKHNPNYYYVLRQVEPGHYAHSKYKAVQNQFGWNSTGGVVQFTTPDGSDPRRPEAGFKVTIHSSVKYYLFNSILLLIGIGLLPWFLRFYVQLIITKEFHRLDRMICDSPLIRNSALGLKIYSALKNPFFYFILIIATTMVYNLFVLDLIADSITTVPDSVTYSSVSPIRPIATVVFLKFLELFSPNYGLVPTVQYLMTVTALGTVALIPGMVVRNYWISVVTILLLLSGFWNIHVDIDNHYIDLSKILMSEPLFFFFTSLGLFFCAKLLLNWDHRRVWNSFGLGLFLGLMILTRNIGISFLMVIPLIILWGFCRGSRIIDYIKVSVIILIPVISLQLVQVAVYRMVTHSDYNGNQGSGYQLLRQAIPATFLDEGRRLTSDPTVLNGNEKLLLTCLLANNRKSIDDYSKIHNPLSRYLYWDDISAWFLHGVAVGELGDIRCTQKILVQDYEFTKGWDDQNFSMKNYLAGQAFNQSLAQKIIRHYPLDFVGLMVVQTLSADVKLIDTEVSPSIFLPLVLFALVLTIWIRDTSKNELFAVVWLFSALSIAYVGVTSLAESPLARYMLVTQIPGTVAFMLVVYWLFVNLHRTLIRDFNPKP